MRKIAFTRVFSTHPFLTSLENLLKVSFPECEIETITVTDLLKRRYDLLALNGLHVFKEYYRDILKNPSVFRQRFLRTPFMFHHVRELVRDHIRKSQGDYLFTYQFQSIFDLSVPDVPHFVYTDHTYRESQKYAFGSSPYSSAWARLEPEIYRNADRVFTWSSNITRSLVDEYGICENKVVCAFTGSNIAQGNEAVEIHDYSSKRILFVGSDWERKGGPALVEAFKLVLEAHPDAELTMIGPAPSIEVPHCALLGRLPLAQLDAHYRQATVFCLPTRREPFGNAFIDALQNHLPIVATRIGAIPDVVKEGENGYLVEPDDVPALAQALIRLLDDAEQRRRFGDHSYAIWKDRYTWENVGCIMRTEIMKVITPG